MIKLQDLLAEDYDTPSKVVSDPANNERTLSDILHDFKEKGGEILGQGTSGMVLAHKKWPFVLKVFTEDAPYLKFVRFVLKNPRKSYPKFFDKPRRILPNYTRLRKNEYLYIVKVEKLEPITTGQYYEIDFYIHYGAVDFTKMPNTEVWYETEKRIRATDKKYPSMKEFLEDYRFLMYDSKIEGTPDITQQNIMKRKNGEFVLSDPFWEGENPYQTHDRLAQAEIGYDDDEYGPPPEMVKGGQKYKKPKPIKFKSLIPVPDEDDIPF